MIDSNMLLFITMKGGIFMKLPTSAIKEKLDIDKEIKETLKESREKTLRMEINEHVKEEMYELPEEEINEVKYVQYIERIIRRSSEYKRYIQTIKREFDLTSCKFYDNVDTTDIRVSLEMHHYPATLFDITHAVREAAREVEDINAYQSFKIADLVMKLHYEGKVGLVPLTKTNHELAHNGALFIPLTDDYVFGDYEALLDDERVKLDDIFKEKYGVIKEMTERYEKTGNNDSLFIFNEREVEISMKTAKPPMKINRVEAKNGTQ